MGRPLITHYLGPRCWPAPGQSASWLGGLPSPGRGSSVPPFWDNRLVSRLSGPRPGVEGLR